MTIMLTERQRAELLAVLRRYAPPIERVDVYGSRATGQARPGSDIDLVLAGEIDRDLLIDIHGALDDSYLSISADVSAYRLITPGVFQNEITRGAQTLFDRAALTGCILS